MWARVAAGESAGGLEKLTVGAERVVGVGMVLFAAIMAQAAAAQLPWTLRVGPQRPDLIRYNRIEALSVGIRGQVRPETFAGPLSVTGTVRLGVADLEPTVNLDIARETIRRRVSFRLYHELAAIDEAARHLGIGNTLTAATIGRDDGDYYRRSGGTLEWTPPTAGRRSFRVRGFVEHHRSVPVETDFALFHWGSDSWSFRPNIDADRGWEYGASVELAPKWGSDPDLMQGGFDVLLQAAKTGAAEYARAGLLGHIAFPLPARLRFAVEAGAGTSWGALSVQRLWYVGGPSTLRGYDPRIGTGTSFGRARGELARAFSFGDISLFSDLGWAGDRDRIRWDDALYSAGAGVSILDGLIRLDSAWGLKAPRDFRFDVYLDQIL